ncbi:hypothetical protein BKA69DRAFT_1037023 [Paraphysoderma sedebokerense]|nr:hypothetical protein BKA69DRAFT_1037023 [Paraphysoderma sedebokerense]
MTAAALTPPSEGANQSASDSISIHKSEGNSSNAIQNSNPSSAVTVRGKPVSGRVWKELKTPTSSMRPATLKKSWSKRAVERSELDRIKKLQNEMKEEKKAMKEMEKQKRKEREERRLENLRKGERVQTVCHFFVNRIDGSQALTPTQMCWIY